MSGDINGWWLLVVGGVAPDGSWWLVTPGIWWLLVLVAPPGDWWLVAPSGWWLLLVAPVGW